MILLPDGRILLSGGATVDEKCVPSYHKDLRQLDTETMLWSKAKTDGGVCLMILAVQLVNAVLRSEREQTRVKRLFLFIYSTTKYEEAAPVTVARNSRRENVPVAPAHNRREDLLSLQSHTHI